ncbi:mitogen-activated protein kinase kinase kinase A-like [Paramacrobiotus metropolitanus]|uniref:mitogen-activated protein kinase kinase kinase A-like n=1 Tax=Paramacrobiotus metropolitanus TaxID=2943436 RepID=UPI00244590D2|nr:mitogen-activated protein kinase kinase kinase A-like [Paramacrobiotus metropolitanus]XP_055343071.1 mitogen-activated protein kinase kinase kinase A-like [Paramacrobiotus metropolitanus]XP_055343072.1 mitogen-activated protein kinase kinase kinase A-like [Paramacrobiotus metropolitanus]XP_055343073.1 mitogen-activated protein kinase kinase kinase A-like [Paramacrobiotus metropolitanus]
MPAACKDFLEHSLNINAGARSSLAELRAHPFVDRNKSLEALYALENLGAETYSVCEGTMKIINTQRHSFLNDTAQCRLQIGEIQLVDNPDMIPGKMVEIWRFQLLNESADRETYKKAFGKLLNLLTTTYSDNERIGRLQADSVNVIHFFAWQFASPLNPGFPPEFQVYAELCRGGNFEDAATHFLPIVMIQKLLYEMLCGLEFLHNNRIVHRNLNSRIIFFTVPGFKGTVKIGGFHNMRQLGTDHTTKHDISARSGDDGRFVAPELVNTSNDYDIGRRSDIWSVGCIALHLLTGQPPLYNGARNQPMLLEMAILYHLNNESNNTGRLPNIPDSLPKNTKEFVLRCLKFNPTERLLTSELLAPNGLLSRFNSDPDNPRRYQIQKIETLSKDTLDYWTNKVYPSST